MAGVHGKAADAGPLPQTPRRLRQEHSEPLHRLVVHLRDVLNVEIDPRDHSYIPSGSLHRHDEKLYKRIQHLFWRCPRQTSKQVPEQLQAEIRRFGDDCRTSHLRDFSPRERANALHDRLFDVNWITSQAITPTPVKSPARKASPPRTSPRSGPFTFRMPGPSRDLVKDEPIAFSLSPALIRSTARTASSASLTTATATSAATSFSPESEVSFKSAPTSFTSCVPTDTSMYRVDSHDTIPEIPSSLGWTQDTVDAVSAVVDSFDQSTDERPAKRRCSSDESFVLVDGTNTSPTVRSSPKSYDTRSRGRKISSPGLKHDVAANETLEDLKAPRTNAEATVATPSPLKTTATHYQVSRFPQSDFDDDLIYSNAPEPMFSVTIERARLARHVDLSVSEVLRVRNDSDVRALIAASPRMSATPFHHSHPAIWTANNSSNTNLTFSGALEFSQKTSEPLFKTTIHPLRVELSCRLQRHFGWDRFFYVTLPSLSRKLPSHLTDHSEKLRQALLEWLSVPKNLLGRSWRAFHIQEVKAKRHASKDDDGKKAYRVIFFATSGAGIRDPIPIEKFLDWMVPLESNLRQPAYKAFTRIDLMVSSTRPSIKFLPTQVRLGVDDMHANGMHEDQAFDDHSRDFGLLMVHDQREVMTDGCARISVGAAKLVCESLKLAHWPTAFQARINGAKGMWYISAPYETANHDDLGIWIEIRKSQLKVQDRGVPRQVLRELVRHGLNLCTDELSSIPYDPVALTFWRHRYFARQEETFAHRLQERALPEQISLRAQILAEQAGYMPTECPILAKAITYMVEHNLQDIRKHIGAPCPRSTTVVGIADHTGQLEPGEVHLALSQPLSHDDDETSSIFAGMNVLVARHPTLRGSDIQKVRCVFQPGLAHLKDVLVMSTKGRVPLASKLQGGDYDGDKFWICADERLTRPFRNAPVLQQDGIHEFGIQQDTTTLADLVSDGIGTAAHAHAWLSKAFEFSLKTNMLGTVTNHFYRLACLDQSLWTAQVKALADLHDIIIDAAKNGYVFDHAAFNAYLSSKGYPLWSQLGPRRFESNIESGNSASNTATINALRKAVSREPDLYSRLHILDDILYNIINLAVKKALEDLESSLAPADDLKSDADLEYPLHQWNALPAADLTKSGMDLQLERMHILKSAEHVFNSAWSLVWSHKRKNASNSATSHAAALAKCFVAYDAIVPVSSYACWHFKHAATAPTEWECFKVAVISQGAYKMRTFLMYMAKDVVVYLKSFSESGRRVRSLVEGVKKPKRPKGWVAGARDVDTFNAEEEEDDEMWDEGLSVFDGLDEVQ